MAQARIFWRTRRRQDGALCRGRKDKNRRDIYADDIVKYHYMEEGRGVVKYSENFVSYEPFNQLRESVWDTIEIIVKDRRMEEGRDVVKYAEDYVEYEPFNQFRESVCDTIEVIGTDWENPDLLTS